MELQEALTRLRESCHVVSSSQIQGLQSIVATLHVEETTAARVLSLCEEMMRSETSLSSQQGVVEERRLLQTYGFPFVEGNQPTLNFLIVAGALLILTILWEILWLRSTMACSKHVESFGAAMTDRIKDLGGMLAEVLKGDMLKLNVLGGARPIEESLESSHETEKETWTRLFEEATKLKAQADEKDAMASRDAAGDCDCEVSFEDLHFRGRASEGEVTVSLVRRGHCVGALEVKVRPHPSYVEDAGGVASNGKDYLFEDTLVRFEESEMKAAVKIKLMEPKSYTTTQYFDVELYKVVKGNAVIGGPSLHQHSVQARVFISYDYSFPHNIPKEKQKFRFWIMWYYLKERYSSRGFHWWKTLIGLLYAPIHAVCVTAFIQKIVLDEICDPEVEGNKPLELMLVGLAQFVSLALLRWGDKVATENRGRTGGTRMVHRQQLFAKLLMLDAEELAQVEGRWWFYVGVNNVDLMAKDAYYQGFVVLQSAFGLALSIFMLLYVQLSKSTTETDNSFAEALAILAVPGAAQIVMVLLSGFLVTRRSRLAELLEKRMAGEAAWVDSFSWLCHAGLPLKSLASRIRARVDLRFASESKYFVVYHKAARDWANDTLWYVKWLVNLAWIVVLVLGAKHLLEARETGSQEFRSGDLVFQLKVFSSFGKYLVKIVDSLIKMYTASVGLQEFSQIMNLPEHSLATGGRLLKDESSEEIVFERTPDVGEIGQHQVVSVPSERVVHKNLQIRLGHVVRVTSERERTLEDFLYQVSELKAPRRGRVRRPQDLRIAFVPAIALHTPHATVMQELRADSHYKEELSEWICRLFQLDPDMEMTQLQAGERQSVAILLALLRNPEVLVLDRPLAFMTSRQRQKILILLSLWQAGGTEALLQRLAGASVDRVLRPKTLITSAEALADLPHALFNHVETIDLDLAQEHCDFWRSIKERELSGDHVTL